MKNFSQKRLDCFRTFLQYQVTTLYDFCSFIVTMQAYSLTAQLERFIKKYYVNEILRGVLINTALLGGSLLVILLLEYWGWLPSVARTLLFFGYLAAFVVASVWWIGRPLFQLLRLGPRISYDQAALIVGQHFSDIRDKLLNALQLERQHQSHPDNSLLKAAIEQKERQLLVFDFRKAVDFRVNNKYLPYALPPLAVLLFLVLAAPSVVWEPAYRLTRFNQEFVPPPPFEFVVKEPLQTKENQTFLLRVETQGSVVPEEMYVETEAGTYRMLSESPGHFSYEFRTPRQNISFRLRSGKYASGVYLLKVLKKAGLQRLEVKARYPAYLSLPSETFEQGDLTVPEGTSLDFNLMLRHTHGVQVMADGETVFPSLRPEKNALSFSYVARRSLRYTLILRGVEGTGDTLSYTLNVIPDQPPLLELEERADSLLPTLRAFKGTASDDYGLRSLYFQYDIHSQGSDKNKKATQKINLPLPSGVKLFTFTHAVDFSVFNLQPGDEVIYAFTVCDNDGVNGSKCTTSPRRVLRIPTLEEQQKRTEQADQALMENLSGSLGQTDRLEKELNSLTRALNEKRSADWQERKKVEDLLKMEEQLRRQMEDLKKNIENANRLREQLPSDPTLEDRKMLEKQAEKLMSDELRRLLEEIQRLLEEQPDKALMKDLLEQARETSVSLEKQLERLKELFKKLELESLMQATADKLENLAREERKEEENNRKVSDKTPESQDKALERQEKLNEAFRQLQNDLKEIQQKNESLENPMENLEDLQEKARQVDSDMQKATEKLSQGQQRSASENQKKAAENMEEMAQELRNQIEQQRQEEQAEDAESIKRLLRNLLTLSFNQEKLMSELKQTSRNSPVFKDLAQKQRRLRDDARTVEDSLFALSKRQIRISDLVNKEIAEIRKNMEKAIQRLADRDGQSAGVHQQYVMTGFNNLAVMLSESLEQMQMQMSMKMKGGGSCSKPGASSEPSEGDMQKIKEMQKKLGEQLQKMAEQMKQGKEGQKPGDQQKVGNQGLHSREIAQIAAQQEMLRRKLRELAEKQGDLQQKKLLNEIQQQMEQNEYDLYNKRITEQSLMRQREIMVRLLEFEKAQRQQEQDEQRQSRTGIDPAPRNIPALREWEKEKERMTEMLRTVPPGLTPYYRERVNRYLDASRP